MWLYNNHHIGCENKAALKWSRECYQESAISFGWEKCKEVLPNVNASHTQSQQWHRTFALASSLLRHSYDHEEQRYQFDVCEFTSHFESELNAHKIVHWKTPTFKCMYKDCGKWFMRKWELTVATNHNQTHWHNDNWRCTAICNDYRSGLIHSFSIIVLLSCVKVIWLKILNIPKHGKLYWDLHFQAYRLIWSKKPWFFKGNYIKLF